MLLGLLRQELIFLGLPCLLGSLVLCLQLRFTTPVSVQPGLILRDNPGPPLLLLLHISVKALLDLGFLCQPARKDQLV